MEDLIILDIESSARLTISTSRGNCYTKWLQNSDWGLHPQPLPVPPRRMPNPLDVETFPEGDVSIKGVP
jgi:hypothetical protein